MTFDSDFKKALQLLPDKEKDKLILKLLKHDLILADRLRFELIDPDSLEEKRETLKNNLITGIKLASASYNYLPHLLIDVRNLVNKINDHVSITKDKIGQISMSLLLTRHLLEQNGQEIDNGMYDESYKLCIYIIIRIFKDLMLIQKIHEDLRIEFKEDIQAIGELISKIPTLSSEADDNELELDWLIEFDIPKDIDEIYKDIRSRGHLR